jgi:hypothetical protein
MKHEILEQVWREREQIFAECDNDLAKFAAMLRREEANYEGRMARLPIRNLSQKGTKLAKERRK